MPLNNSVKSQQHFKCARAREKKIPTVTSVTRKDKRPPNLWFSAQSLEPNLYADWIAGKQNKVRCGKWQQISQRARKGSSSNSLSLYQRLRKMFPVLWDFKASCAVQWFGKMWGWRCKCRKGDVRWKNNTYLFLHVLTELVCQCDKPLMLLILVALV